MKKAVISMGMVLGIAAGMATMPIGVYADEQVNKDYIADLIWEEWWFGTPEDGTQFPEASYEHHLIESWLDENFDEYKDDVPYAIYAYREYYKDLVSNWAFEDDDNGNYYITDLDGNILYHFNFVNGKWNMADENGNVVDSFMPFNTVEWEKEQEAKEEVNQSDSNSEEESKDSSTSQQHKQNNNRSNNTGNSVHRVLGKTTQQPATEAATDEVTEAEQTTVKSSAKRGLLCGTLLTAVIIIIIFVVMHKKNYKKGNEHDTKK